MIVTLACISFIHFQESPPNLDIRVKSAFLLPRITSETQLSDAALADSGKFFFARVPGPEIEKFSDTGERSFRGERLFLGLDGPAPKMYVRTYSQSSSWSPKRSSFASLTGNSIELIGLTGPSSLLVETQLGYASKDKRFAGVSEVRFDKRGRDANIDLMFPKDRTGSYNVVHTTIGKYETWLLVVHQIGGTQKTRLEAYQVIGRKLARLPGPYRRLDGLIVPSRKSSRRKAMQVWDVDPAACRAFLFEGRDWIELGLLDSTELKGTFTPKMSPNPYKVRYVRGSAYGGMSDDALYRLDRKTRAWAKIGPYRIIGISASEQFMLVRHAVSGELWMLELNGP